MPEGRSHKIVDNEGAPLKRQPRKQPFSFFIRPVTLVCHFFPVMEIFLKSLTICWVRLYLKGCA